MGSGLSKHCPMLVIPCYRKTCEISISEYFTNFETMSKCKMFKNLPEHPPFNLAFLMLLRSPHELDLEKLPPNIFAQLAGDLRTNYIYLEISSRPKDSESAIIGGG